MSEDWIEEHYFVRKLRCPETGVVADEKWEKFKDHSLHNPDGAALVERDPVTGRDTLSAHFIDGEPHRLPGEPSYERFDPVSWKCIYRSFSVDGEFSRPNGLPHVEWIDPETNVIFRAEYVKWNMKKGGRMLHREDGHALITRDRQSGEINGAYFYINGRKRKSLPNPIL